TIPLSSVRQPREDLGRQAATLLLEEVRPPSGGHEHQHVVFTPELVARASTAPPPSRPPLSPCRPRVTPPPPLPPLPSPPPPPPPPPPSPPPPSPPTPHPHRADSRISPGRDPAVGGRGAGGGERGSEGALRDLGRRRTGDGTR